VADPGRRDEATDPVADMVSHHERGESFQVKEWALDEQLAERFVRFRSNPPRFSKQVFDGDWALVNEHPEPGPIRIVRVITGNDGVSRVIGRQGEHLYASPWFA